MSTSGLKKILIKPRQKAIAPTGSSRQDANDADAISVDAPTPASVNVETPGEDRDENEDDVEAADSEGNADEEEEDDEEEEEEEEEEGGEGGDEGGDEEDKAEEEEAEDEPINAESDVPVKRGRGRPKGSGTGSSGTRGKASTKSRGTGRGRGRPPGLTIRLPGRNEDEGTIPGFVTDVNEGVIVDPEEPMGGGKPFRKIRGKVFIIEGDAFITDEDPVGNTKIDEDGNLLGGRRFKAQTFILPQRHPTRVYMLAIDAARTSGFRDSLYYFRRNPLAFKLNVTQPEKDYLIELGKLGSHLKTRSVTLITARSAYKLHGSKMVVDGRWVTDDYYEASAKEEAESKGAKSGELVGELPDPSMYTKETLSLQEPPALRGDTSKQGLYRAGGPTTIFGGSGWGPYSDGPHNAVRKSFLSREGLTKENYMAIAAERTSALGEEYRKLRAEGISTTGEIAFRSKRDEEGEELETDKPVMKKRKIRPGANNLSLGAYEPHSAILQYRSDTQPTRSRWEAVPDPEGTHWVLGGVKTGNNAWAVAWVDTYMEVPLATSDS